MLDILEDHLQQCVSIARYDLYKQVFHILEQLGVQNDEYYNNLFMVGDDVVEDINVAIHDALMQDTYGVLSAHGIGVDLEASLDKLLPVLYFLVMIEDTEFIKELYDIVKSDQYDDAEKLSQCIEQVVGINVSETLPVLVDIPHTVIVGIGQYVELRMSTAPTDKDGGAVEQAQYIQAVTQYVKIVQGYNMKCYEHVQIDDIQLGLPLDYYWEYYKNYLTSIPMEAMVYELIGFCLIAEDNDKNPVDVISPIVEKYYGSDIDQLTRVNILINNTMINLKNAASCGLFFQPGSKT